MTAIPKSFYVGLTLSAPEQSPRLKTRGVSFPQSSASIKASDNERTALSLEAVAAQFKGRLRRFQCVGESESSASEDDA